MTAPHVDMLDDLATLVDEAANYAGPSDDDNGNGGLWSAIDAAEAQLPALRALLGTVAALGAYWNDDDSGASATDVASDLGTAWATFVAARTEARP